MEGSGVAISVDRSGTPWVLNAAGEIYSWNGDRFLVRSGTARDVGAADEVWDHRDRWSGLPPWPE
jgi:hypothetical protein